MDVIYMDTSLEVSDINIYYNVPIIIKATLKGNDIILLNDKIVWITVNGKTYKNITVEGVATFNIGTLPKDSYYIDYLFCGDKNCTKSNGNSKIFVNMMPTNIGAKNVVMFYKDKSGIVAYLRDNAGKGIGGKTISIRINGKVYKKLIKRVNLH